MVYTRYSSRRNAVETFKCISQIPWKYIFFIITCIVLCMKSESCMRFCALSYLLRELHVRIRQLDNLLIQSYWLNSINNQDTQSILWYFWACETGSKRYRMITKTFILPRRMIQTRCEFYHVVPATAMISYNIVIISLRRKWYRRKLS